MPTNTPTILPFSLFGAEDYCKGRERVKSYANEKSVWLPFLDKFDPYSRGYLHQVGGRPAPCRSRYVIRVNSRSAATVKNCTLNIVVDIAIIIIIIIIISSSSSIIIHVASTNNRLVKFLLSFDTNFYSQL